MAKSKLTPKCKEMLEQLRERAELQLRAAYPALKAQGRLHTYTAQSSFGKQVSWNDCFSAYCTVLRIDESGNLVYHDHNECWYPLQWCKSIPDLCECADYLLNVANGNNQ